MTIGFVEGLAELGPRFDATVLEKTRTLVAALPRRAGDVPIQTATRSYGLHERQKLDVYWAGATFKRMLLLVPGGGFVGGSRLGYREFGEFYAACGYLVCIADYRLAPEAAWPASAEDVGAFIAYARNHAAEFGRCPDGAILIGHSAGATHVAAAALDKRFNDAAKRTITGLALISGLYTFPFLGMESNVPAYIGSDTSQYDDRSPINHLDPGELSIAVTASEWEPPYFLASALMMAERLSQLRPARSRVSLLRQHNHISPLLTSGTDHDAISPILDSL